VVLNVTSSASPTHPTTSMVFRPFRVGSIIAFFRWSGFDEGAPIAGHGSAELLDNGSLEIELSFDNKMMRSSPLAANNFRNSLVIGYEVEDGFPVVQSIGKCRMMLSQPLDQLGW
jgi:hypothetical protein